MTSTDGTGKRRRPSKGQLVTMATVLALVAGLGITVRGLGSADQALASFDAASWLWSKGKAELARINGTSARVDTRADVGQSTRGHQLQVSQSDRFVILRDVNTGAIASMDLTDLQAYWNAESQAGIGVSVALHDRFAFVVDAVQGKVQQVDPSSLQPVGDPLQFPPGISGGVFDGAGVLWIAAPSEGTVTAVKPGEGEGVPPSRVRTDPVAAPSHDLAVSAMDKGVAVLDRTTNGLVKVTETGAGETVTLPLTGPGELPPRTDGDLIAVTVPDDRRVYTVGGSGIREMVVPAGSGGELRTAVAYEGYVYVPENDGTVHVFDENGQPEEPFDIRRPGGDLELDVRENHLFINAPGSSTARVVNDQHTVRSVDKYDDEVLGGDPPPVKSQPEPPKPKKPKKPVVSKPSAPRAVRAAAGNAEVRVTWQAAAPNGAAITRYVVTGADQTFPVGADQRSLVVPNLTNGETYRFEVHAVNRKGDGPAKQSNPVVPTSEVPDPPATPPVAEAKPDGTVAVTWPEANGQGHKIQRYAVTAVTEGGGAPVGESTSTTLAIPAGQLEFGKQYAFTVVAINDIGAGSKASGVSNTVVPFAVPAKPDGVQAATVADQAGAVRVTWTAPAENGRPITKYVVTAGGKETEVTETTATLTGLGTGATVQVQVVAVNEAGPGEAAGATARTVAAPTVTVTGVDPTFNTARVAFNVNGGGGTTTCTLTVSGGGKGSSGSCTALNATGLKPSTAYTFTVTAKNAAGSANKASAKTTDILYGTATCINGDDGDQRTYCNSDVDGRNGNEIFRGTTQNDSQQAGWVKNGTRLQTYCKKSGEEVYAFVYNKNKRSTWWIQVNYSGKTYIPWAWLNLDGGDDLGNLPTC
ncbi:fibronectin type III domain-containing protein [Actinoplanes sp. G11-F43]|uniref:fibronectin type III domain-containing protein n=1 Tax=Actinoplanes sp. G11-F43 TaxID=3424130 RepID=UPI003D33FEA0